MERRAPISLSEWGTTIHVGRVDWFACVSLWSRRVPSRNVLNIAGTDLLLIDTSCAWLAFGSLLLLHFCRSLWIVNAPARGAEHLPPDLRHPPSLVCSAIVTSGAPQDPASAL
jgi:hypothetical protein